MTTVDATHRSADDVFVALADRQRRRLLLALLESNPQADGSVASQTDGGVDELDPALRMYHVHLPKLADYGFVEWDREAGEVTRGSRFAEIEPLLELLDDHRAELPADWL